MPPRSSFEGGGVGADPGPACAQPASVHRISNSTAPLRVFIGLPPGSVPDRTLCRGCGNGSESSTSITIAFKISPATRRGCYARGTAAPMAWARVPFPGCGIDGVARSETKTEVFAGTAASRLAAPPHHSEQDVSPLHLAYQMLAWLRSGRARSQRIFHWSFLSRFEGCGDRGARRDAA